MSTSSMSKRERVAAALRGGPVDRVPVAFWRHFPGDDLLAESLALVALDFQRRYDLDLIKMPVSSTFCVDDYGVTHAYRGSAGGDREYLERAVRTIEDWERIRSLDVGSGAHGMYLRAIRTVVERRDADVPVIATMFNPLAVAFYLAGDETCLVHLRRYPQLVGRAVAALTETCAGFARAAIAAGADGIFLSVRAASYEVMSEEEYLRFGRSGDLAVLEAAAGGWFNVLHLHGQHPMWSLVSGCPAHAVNWHDRTAGPGLAQAAGQFKGALMAGVEQHRVLQLGAPRDVEAQVHDAISQTGGRRLIVAPGCTYPLGVPHANLLAMRRAVETTWH